jgi:hypothetical protein
MPPHSNMAFVIIQHLSPKHKSIMASILEKHTQLKVTPVEDGVKLEPDHVYLNPPGMNVAVQRSNLCHGYRCSCPGYCPQGGLSDQYHCGSFPGAVGSVFPERSGLLQGQETAARHDRLFTAERHQRSAFFPTGPGQLQKPDDLFRQCPAKKDPAPVSLYVKARRHSVPGYIRKYRRKTKDGTILETWLTASALTDENGRLAEIAITERDLAWLAK